MMILEKKYSIHYNVNVKYRTHKYGTTIFIHFFQCKKRWKINREYGTERYGIGMYLYRITVKDFVVFFNFFLNHML